VKCPIRTSGSFKFHLAIRFEEKDGWVELEAPTTGYSDTKCRIYFDSNPATIEDKSVIKTPSHILLDISSLNVQSILLSFFFHQTNLIQNSLNTFLRLYYHHRPIPLVTKSPNNIHTSGIYLFQLLQRISLCLSSNVLQKSFDSSRILFQGGMMSNTRSLRDWLGR
jgi:hypothetical protein